MFVAKETSLKSDSKQNCRPQSLSKKIDVSLKVRFQQRSKTEFESKKTVSCHKPACAAAALFCSWISCRGPRRGKRTDEWTSRGRAGILDWGTVCRRGGAGPLFGRIRVVLVRPKAEFTYIFSGLQTRIHFMWIKIQGFKNVCGSRSGSWSWS